MPKYTCAHCGDKFQSDRVSRPPKFCSRSCVSGAAGVSVECVVCGTTFKVPPSLAASRRYCRSACRWQVECAVKSCGVGYADCAWCGKLFVHRPKGRKTYCNRECELQGRRRTRNTRLGFSGDKVDRSCETCGASFAILASKAERHAKGRFCSRRCLGVAMRQTWAYGSGAGPSRVAVDAIALWRDANPGVLSVEELRVGPWSIDLALPVLMTAIELDGVYWHSLPGSADRDSRKDAYLVARGWRVVRVPMQSRDTPQTVAKKMIEYLERA